MVRLLQCDEAVIDFLQVELGPFLQRPQGLVIVLPEFGRSHCSDYVRDGDKKLILQVVGVDVRSRCCAHRGSLARVNKIVNGLVLFGARRLPLRQAHRDYEGRGELKLFCLVTCVTPNREERHSR